jgi:hypothetical protein
MAQRSVFSAALLVIILAASSRQAVAELALAGAGASQCDIINSNAAPGRGSGQAAKGAVAVIETCARADRLSVCDSTN